MLYRHLARLGAALFAACSLPANAQTFPDVSGLDFTLTGKASVDVTFGPLPGVGGSFEYAQTFQLFNGVPPPNTSTTTYLEAPHFTLTGSGSPIETVTGAFNLGTVIIDGTPNTLPAVQLNGTFDRNLGAFNGVLSTGAADTLSFNQTVTPSMGGPVSVPFTLTIGPNATWDVSGQASLQPGALVVTGTGGNSNIPLSATATVTLPGVGPTTETVPLTVSTLSIDNFTATAVPEPSVVTLLLASGGSLVLLRRRR